LNKSKESIGSKNIGLSRLRGRQNEWQFLVAINSEFRKCALTSNNAAKAGSRVHAKSLVWIEGRSDVDTHPEASTRAANPLTHPRSSDSPNAVSPSASGLHPDGFEPPTYSSVDCRSIQLSYGCFSIADVTIWHNPVLARRKTAGVTDQEFRSYRMGNPVAEIYSAGVWGKQKTENRIQEFGRPEQRPDLETET
jgi:hypothetical protein